MSRRVARSGMCSWTPGFVRGSLSLRVGNALKTPWGLEVGSWWCSAWWWGASVAPKSKVDLYAAIGRDARSGRSCRLARTKARAERFDTA